MDTIFKTYKAEIRGINEDDGSVDMFIPVSSNTVDRDGEVVEPTAFKKTLPKFMKRPVLVSSHDYRDLTSQIGEWKHLKITTEGLEGKPVYYVDEGNEQADWGFKLAKKGMAAFSIGFIPKVWEDGDGVKTPRRTYKEVELLEISQVIVPSNREAIQSIRAKSIDPIVGEICNEIEKELEGGGENGKEKEAGQEEGTKEVITKPEETENYIRIPAKGEEGKHDGHRIRTITLNADEGIKSLYCGQCKKVITYLFDKDKGWTMAKARAWVKEHEKSATQAELIDEIDFLKTLIEKEGLSEEAKRDFEDLMRVSGYDKPVEIQDNSSKIGDKFIITYPDIQESLKRIMEVKYVIRTTETRPG